MKKTMSIMMAIALAAAAVSCGSGGSGPGGDADVIPEPTEEQAAETPAEEAPDVVRDPDAAEAAEEEALEIVDAPDGEEIRDVIQEEEIIQTAQWICIGPNPDRIGGCRNGSEKCDDDAFNVTGDRLGPLVLACFAGDQGPGIAYVATNTGPACTTESCSGLENNIPRCQGFEKCECEDAWAPGNLQYASDGLGVIKILSCPVEGAIRDVDLSAYAGQNMWVGSHTQPDGTGRMTESCLSKKTW